MREFLLLSLMFAATLGAEPLRDPVIYCEPQLYPVSGFYMLDSTGNKYIPPKVYMSQLLGLNITSEPDYKAWAENPPTEEGFSKSMLRIMPLLDQNDACDCVGTKYSRGEVATMSVRGAVLFFCIVAAKFP